MEKYSVYRILSIISLLVFIATIWILKAFPKNPFGLGLVFLLLVSVSGMGIFQIKYSEERYGKAPRNLKFLEDMPSWINYVGAIACFLSGFFFLSISMTAFLVNFNLNILFFVAIGLFLVYFGVQNVKIAKMKKNSST